MQNNALFLITKVFIKNAFKTKAFYIMVFLMVAMIGFAAYSGWKNYRIQNGIRTYFQQAVRQSWENNPDKHPHRMAHFGTFAFRLKHRLSMFDFGMESFTGNAVFLEAHKQNTINFSEASFSTGLLRFGEISMSMLLQVIFPLMIFFLGFAAVASERENGTLKLLLCQGADWKDIMLGKSFGLYLLTLLFFTPVILLTSIFIFTRDDLTVNTDDVVRLSAVIFFYLIFFFIVCFITIIISASGKTSKEALVKLLGIWLFFVVLLPRTTQALGSFFYPSPSKIEFEAAVEEDLIKEGDSHNPDDPHYKALKDSLLIANNVKTVEELPFNYSGFLMKEGEKMSTEIYNRHLEELLLTYQQQNAISRATALINPFTAIRNISMAFSGTDFKAYLHFQKQAEAYRYMLAQEMNDLQIKFISNKKACPEEKPQQISSTYWKAFPDFDYKFMSSAEVFKNELFSIISIVIWCIGAFLLLNYFSKNAKAL